MANISSIVNLCTKGDTFAGKNYSDWVVDWNRWLVSADIITDTQGSMCFTHGNLNYQYDKDGSSRIMNPFQETYSRINDKGILVSTKTGIFVPVITSTRLIGFRDYGGETLYTELDLKNYSKNDIDQGGMYYFKVQKQGDNNEYSLSDLKDYRFETPLYNLDVSEKNPYLDKFEVPLEPGSFQAVTSGIFVIFQFGSSGTYLVAFGGDGSGTYKTRALYSFTVIDESNKTKGPTSFFIPASGNKLPKPFDDASEFVSLSKDINDEDIYKSLQNKSKPASGSGSQSSSSGSGS